MEVQQVLCKHRVLGTALGERSKATSIQISRGVRKKFRCLSGGIGRHKGLKIPRLKGRAGSSPASGTI